MDGEEVKDEKVKDEEVKDEKKSKKKESEVIPTWGQQLMKKFQEIEEKLAVETVEVPKPKPLPEEKTPEEKTPDENPTPEVIPKQPQEQQKKKRGFLDYLM